MDNEKVVHPRCDKCEQVMVLDCDPKGERHFWSCPGCGITFDASPEAVDAKGEQIEAILRELPAGELAQLFQVVEVENKLLRVFVHRIAGTDPDQAGDDVWWQAQALLEDLLKDPAKLARALQEVL